jgi:bacterial peptidase A24 domain protein
MVTSAKKTSIVLDAFNKKENRLFNAFIALIVVLNAAMVIMKMIEEPANWFSILYYCSSISVLTTLIMLSVEDLATKMVSNTFLYFGLFGSLAITLLYLFFYGDYYNMLAMAIFASLFWLIRSSFLVIREKEVVGDGDIFVVAIIAGLLGFVSTIIAIFLAALLALPVILLSKDKEIPFVPFLTIGTFFCFYLGEQFLPMLGVFVNA